MKGEKPLSSLIPSSKFLAPLSGSPIFKIGELHTIFYLCFLVLLVYLLVFILVCFIKNHKTMFACFFVAAFIMGSTQNNKWCDFTIHNNNDFISTTISPPATLI